MAGIICEPTHMQAQLKHKRLLQPKQLTDAHKSSNGAQKRLSMTACLQTKWIGAQHSTAIITYAICEYLLANEHYCQHKAKMDTMRTWAQPAK